MNLFESVKHSITTRQAAEAFGLSVNRNGMTLCPFHQDTRPSLLLDKRYYCFGCHATGDVIDFTARLHGISSAAAAKKLAELFGEFSETVSCSHSKADSNMEPFCLGILRRYLRLLRIWRLRYEPQQPGEPLHDRFVESCRMTAMVDHLLDELLDADSGKRKWTVDILTKDDLIYDLNTYVIRKEQEEMGLARKEELLCA